LVVVQRPEYDNPADEVLFGSGRTHAMQHLPGGSSTAEAQAIDRLAIALTTALANLQPPQQRAVRRQQQDRRHRSQSRHKRKGRHHHSSSSSSYSSSSSSSSSSASKRKKRHQSQERPVQLPDALFGAAIGEAQLANAALAATAAPAHPSLQLAPTPQTAAMKVQSEIAAVIAADDVAATTTAAASPGVGAQPAATTTPSLVVGDDGAGANARALAERPLAQPPWLAAAFGRHFGDVASGPAGGVPFLHTGVYLGAHGQTGLTGTNLPPFAGDTNQLPPLGGLAPPARPMDAVTAAVGDPIARLIIDWFTKVQPVPPPPPPPPFPAAWAPPLPLGMYYPQEGPQYWNAPQRPPAPVQSVMPPPPASEATNVSHIAVIGNGTVVGPQAAVAGDVLAIAAAGTGVAVSAADQDGGSASSVVGEDSITRALRRIERYNARRNTEDDQIIVANDDSFDVDRTKTNGRMVDVADLSTPSGWSEQTPSTEENLLYAYAMDRHGVKVERVHFPQPQSRNAATPGHDVATYHRVRGQLLDMRPSVPPFDANGVSPPSSATTMATTDQTTSSSSVTTMSSHTRSRRMAALLVQLGVDPAADHLGEH
jgi:hypothetical protein